MKDEGNYYEEKSVKGVKKHFRETEKGFFNLRKEMKKKKQDKN